ncbi:MAG: hypothetical protein AAGA77_22325, partial [Bacteroidota bacterium]
ISSIFIIFLALALAGCKTDVPPEKEITQDDLVGEWEIFYAERNGRITKSLEKGKFVFGADNLVSSNLFNRPNSLNFTYNKGTISIEGDPNMTSLNIDRLQNDTLVISSKMKVFNMVFHLKKK